MKFLARALAPFRKLMRGLRIAVGLLGSVIIEAIGYRELMLLAGVGMVGYGVASLVSSPAGVVVSGAIFVCVAIFGVRT